MSNQKITFSFPLTGILGIVFITLKLSHVIDWAWAWVLSPFWISAALGLFLYLLGSLLIYWGRRRR